MADKYEIQHLSQTQYNMLHYKTLWSTDGFARCRMAQARQEQRNIENTSGHGQDMQDKCTAYVRTTRTTSFMLDAPFPLVSM
jgi:hypothetical protein